MGETMKFSDLKVGEMFKFFDGGSLLIKSGNRRYDAPQWDQFDNPADDLDQLVIPYAPPTPTT